MPSDERPRLLGASDLETLRRLLGEAGLSPWEAGALVARYLERPPRRGGLAGFLTDERLVTPEVVLLFEAGETVVMDGEGPGGAAVAGPLAGRYRDLEEIGRGGVGVVYRGIDPGLERPVALKFLQDPSPGRIQRFVREARLLGQLEHPHIVPVHEFQDGGEGGVYLSMKWVRGRSLGEVLSELRQGGDQAARRERFHLLQQFLKVLDAVAFAHSRGIIHRDLKPGNVMIGEFGEVMVADWGLARRIDAGSEAEVAPASPGPVPEDPQLTGTNEIMGTPLYMAPEQAVDSRRADARSDVYALGATLYELLTLEPAFEFGGPIDLLRRKVEGELVPPSDRSPGAEVPRELEGVVLRAMALDPQERYQTVAELRADLDAWLSGLPLSAVTYSPWQRAALWVRRHKALSAVATVSAAILLVSSTAFVVSLGRKNRALQERAEELGQANLELQARDAAVRARLAESLEERAWAERSADAVLLAAAGAAAALEVEDSPERRGLAIEAAGDLWRVHRVRLPRPVAAAAWSEGELALATSEGRVVRWKDGLAGQLLRLQAGAPADLAFSPDGLRLAGAHGGRAVVWDARTGGVLVETALAEEEVGPSLVSWSPDGGRLAVGRRLMTKWILVLDAGSGKRLARLEGPGGELHRLAWAPDGSRLAAGFSEGAVVIWERDRPDESTKLDLPARPGPALAWSPEARLAFATANGFAAPDGSHDAPWPVHALAWSPDGTRIAAAGGNAFGVWASRDGELRPEFSRLAAGRIDELAWSPRDSILALHTADLAVEIWNARTGTRLAGLGMSRADPLPELPAPAGLVWSPDGRRLAAFPLREAAGYSGAAYVFERDPGFPERVVPGPGGRVLEVAWSPDGTLAIAAEGGLELAAPSGDARSNPAGALGSLAFSSTGQTLAALEKTPEGRRALRLFDVATGEESERVAAWEYAWSPSAPVLAAWYPDTGHLRILDGRDGRVLAETRIGEGMLLDLEYRPDGAILAASSDANTVTLFDGRTLEAIRTLRTPADVRAVAWSPDGARVASASGEVVRIWDAASGLELGRVRHRIDVFEVVWSPDGALLAGGGAGDYAMWDAGTLSPAACPARRLDRARLLAAPDGAAWALFQADEGLEVLAPADRRVLARLPSRGALGEPAAAWSRDGRFLAHVYRRTEVAVRSSATLRAGPEEILAFARDRAGIAASPARK